MRGVIEQARLFFGDEEQVRLAEPEYIGIKSPIYGTAVGMVCYVQRHQPLGYSQRRERGAGKKAGNLFRKIREWFNDFME